MSMIQSPMALRLLAMTVALTGLAACKKDEEPAPPIRPVLAVEPVHRTETVFGPFAGTVEARYQSTLGFRTSGRMIRRSVFVGDPVSKGQELAVLDDTLLRLALAKATADVRDAEAQLKNATAAQARKRFLNSTDVVPQSQVDTADADFRTAQAKLEEMRAAQAKAQDNLGYTHLLSDFDGVVTEWKAEVGQEIAQGNGVVTVARPDVREAFVDIPDTLIGTVHTGDTFTVRLQASDTVTAQGVVREIAPVSDSATRTRRVRFTLDARSDAFRLGSTVTVALTTPSEPVSLVPAVSLWDDHGRPSVWVVAAQAQAVAARAVTVARIDGATAEVAAGIETGDRIVTAGIHSLKAGQAVSAIGSFPPRSADERPKAP